MAIVRELLISIGFKTDKKAINETNRAITGFKTRFAIAATAATYAFKVIKDFFGDIASATLDSNELAKSLGISLKELIAIQTAAQKVGRLDFSQTNQAFNGLNKMLNDFRQGTGTALAEIARGFKFEIDPNSGPEKLFNQILEGLHKIESDQERIRIASNIFGDNLGARISALAKNIDEYRESVNNFQDVGQEAENSLASLKAYEEAVNDLSRAWSNLTLALSKTVFPVLQKIIEYLTIASDFYKSIFQGDAKGTVSVLEKGSKALDPIFEATGLNKISDFFKNIWMGNTDYLKGFNDYIENRQGYQYQTAGITPSQQAPQITVNNDISVPLGTDSEMANSLAESVNLGVQQAINDTFYKIQNNNPVVE